MQFIAAVAIAYAALSGVDVDRFDLPTLFRVPVLQGNVVDAEKVVQLEEGMTPRQVQYLLGTPLIENNFDGQRWDYVFHFRDRNNNVNQSQLSLFFEEGKLARIVGAEAYQATLPEETRELDAEKLNQTPPSNTKTVDEPPTADLEPGPEDNPGTEDI